MLACFYSLPRLSEVLIGNTPLNHSELCTNLLNRAKLNFHLANFGLLSLRLTFTTEYKPYCSHTKRKPRLNISIHLFLSGFLVGLVRSNIAKGAAGAGAELTAS